MQHPLNTGADDWMVLQDTEVFTESAIMSQEVSFFFPRKDGLGSDDIYGVRMRKDAFIFKCCSA